MDNLKRGFLMAIGWFFGMIVSKYVYENVIKTGIERIKDSGEDDSTEHIY